MGEEGKAKIGSFLYHHGGRGNPDEREDAGRPEKCTGGDLREGGAWGEGKWSGQMFCHLAGKDRVPRGGHKSGLGEKGKGLRERLRKTEWCGRTEIIRWCLQNRHKKDG